MGDYTTNNGWELVEQRESGYWYGVRRVFGGRDAYDQLYAWMLSAGRSGNHHYRIRAVNVDEPPLSRGATSMLDYQGDLTMADARRTQAKEDGASLSGALSIILVGNSESEEYRAAVFTLGRRFAAMTEYGDADGALGFIEGFIQAFRIPTPQVRQLSPASKARQDALNAITGEG